MRNDQFLAFAVLLASIWSLAATCREDPGNPDYSSQQGIRERNTPLEALPGPVPFVEGVPRLGVGLFYEGTLTEQVLIDPDDKCDPEPPPEPPPILLCEIDTNYFIFDDSYTQETTDDRVEGVLSDAIILTGFPFWGGGVFWNRARDLSEYTTLTVSLKSSDDAFENVNISVQSGPDSPGDATAFTVSARTYGYDNDGTWYTLTIPFTDFFIPDGPSFDPTSVRSPFNFGGGFGLPGETLLIDDVYIQ